VSSSVVCCHEYVLCALSHLRGRLGGVITFQGQILLKGMHDDVKISILEEDSSEEEKKTETVETEAAPEASQQTKPAKEASPAPKPTPSESTKKKSEPKLTTKNAKDEYAASLRRQSPHKFKFDSSRNTPTNSPVVSGRKSDSMASPYKSSTVASPNKEVQSSPLCTRSPFSKRLSTGASSDVSLSPFRKSPQRSSPIVSKRKHEIAGTSSDGEAEAYTRQYQPPFPIGVCSDSDADGRTTRRGRVTLPPVFLAQKSMPTLDTSGRPPAPWKLRKAKSSMNVTKSPEPSSTRRASIGGMPSAEMKKELIIQEIDEESKVETKDEVQIVPEPSIEPETIALEDTIEVKETEPTSPTSTKENDGSSANIESGKKTPSSTAKVTESVEPTVKQKSFQLSREVSMRVDNEVHQLLDDIHRVGSNPGVPSVTFGELFDDETVQDTYEALVGTLRSAKRQGYIDFEGQMLFKGVHDDVTIDVVDQSRADA